MRLFIFLLAVLLAALVTAAPTEDGGSDTTTTTETTIRNLKPSLLSQRHRIATASPDTEGNQDDTTSFRPTVSERRASLAAIQGDRGDTASLRRTVPERRPLTDAQRDQDDTSSGSDSTRLESSPIDAEAPEADASTTETHDNEETPIREPQGRRRTPFFSRRHGAGRSNSTLTDEAANEPSAQADTSTKEETKLSDLLSSEGSHLRPVRGTEAQDDKDTTSFKPNEEDSSSPGKNESLSSKLAAGTTILSPTTPETGSSTTETGSSTTETGSSTTETGSSTTETGSSTTETGSSTTVHPRRILQ